MTLCASCIHNATRYKILPEPVACRQLDRGLSPGWPRAGGVLQRGREVECPQYKREPQLTIVE